MNGLALCSGIGGLDLGLKFAIGERYRTVCHVERDAYAASVLVARMEDAALDCAPIWDDVTTFRGEPWRGVVDLVSAGFPCQPWSVAGKRKGTEDERWIWPAIVRIIRESGAPLVFLENVPGLLRHGLREVLSDLAEIGFDAEWTCVSAADVGAPHRRERVFILAYRDGRGQRVLRESAQQHGQEPHASDAGALADAGFAERPRRNETAEGPGHGHEARREPSSHRGADVAHGNEHGREVLRVLGLLDGERPARGDDADGCAAELEHPERPRLEGRGHPGPQRFAFPPGPGDAAGWERWLAAGGPAPAESGLRGSVDGLSPRMDRLRCLGNGVVPAQAARAFRILCERLA